jgi:hypothetical protein
MIDIIYLIDKYYEALNYKISSVSISDIIACQMFKIQNEES